MFISYSHDDEEYMAQFVNHISVMKREGLIKEWHDRKIIPGQEWDKEINDHLLTSTIIIMLISSDFLGSDYCNDVEVAKAMELHELKKARVIPVIVRSCDWSRTPFSKLQSMPKNVVPVKKWEDEDDAWLDVAKGIRKVINDFSPALSAIQLSIKTEHNHVTDDFSFWLQDTEILLTHAKVSKILLDDIYVQPDLRAVADNDINKFEIKPAFDVILNRSKCIIFGEEQQGKTSLLKQSFKECYLKGLTPIYLKGSNINTSDYLRIIQKAAKLQYEEQIEIDGKNVVLLIDDFENLHINDKARSQLLKSIASDFEHIIITCSKSFSYIAPEVPELDKYQAYNILRFGHEKRAEIIEKWVSLGIEEQITESDLYKRSDEIKIKIDSIVRGNVVPPKPIYILMIMQMFEASSQHNLKLTSHGHCYQELIYQAFRQASIPPNETGSYLNILTELAWAQHKNGIGFLSDEMDDFFDSYENEFLKVNRKTVKTRLQSNAILVMRDGKLEFKYPYLYYFFVAKKIAEGYSKSEEIRADVQILLRDLHREDFANILVFVTHHTKNDWILEEIQVSLMELFEEEDKAQLTGDSLSFMKEFLSEIPDLVMEKREVSRERREHHKRLDQIEETEESPSDDGKYIDSNDLLAKINKVFKGMEIAGQIVRNRHSSLPRKALYSLVEEGAGTGLRFLNYFINLSDLAKSEVVRMIEERLREHPNLTDEQVRNFAKTSFLQITYGVINGIIKKIATAIGSKEAYEIYDQLEQREATPAVKLLNKAISMHFSKQLNIEEIKKTASELQNNAVCTRILRELVIQHTYMFPVGYKEKQKLSEILKISVHGQRLLDLKTETKV